jgi:hypothetical protein
MILAGERLGVPSNFKIKGESMKTKSFKTLAIAFVMLAAIGCGGGKSSTPPLNWDGLYMGTGAWAGSTMNIIGASPSYSVAVGAPCGESTVNFTTDSSDSSQTSNITLVSTACEGGSAFGEPQEWKLSGNTITITYEAPYSGTAVYTKQQ